MSASTSSRSEGNYVAAKAGFGAAGWFGTAHECERDSIDMRGVCSLLEVVWRVAGRDARTAVLELATTASAAEQWLPHSIRALDGGFNADLAELHGNASHQTPSGVDASTDINVTPAGGEPTEPMPARILGGWQELNAWSRLDASRAARPNCAVLFHQLLDEGLPEPEPNGPTTWSTGIVQVEVVDPCAQAPTLKILGRGLALAANPTSASCQRCATRAASWSIAWFRRC